MCGQHNELTVVCLQVVRVIQFGDHDAIQPSTVGGREHLDGAIASTDDVDVVTKLSDATYLTVSVDARQLTWPICLWTMKSYNSKVA